MTVDDVLARVAHIREIAGDEEAAHSEEDNLYEAVLRAIAAGDCNDPAALAIAALRTNEIDFFRWCA